MRREADFNTYFQKWLKEVRKGTMAYECKQAPSALPFSALQEHQAKALLQVRHGTFAWKIPDAGWQNPFDGFSMTRMPAYVVIRYPKGFAGICIDNFLAEAKASARKSLTWARALEICTFSHEFGKGK